MFLKHQAPTMPVQPAFTVHELQISTPRVDYIYRTYHNSLGFKRLPAPKNLHRIYANSNLTSTFFLTISEFNNKRAIYLGFPKCCPESRAISHVPFTNGFLLALYVCIINALSLVALKEMVRFQACEMAHPLYPHPNLTPPV